MGRGLPARQDRGCRRGNRFHQLADRTAGGGWQYPSPRRLLGLACSRRTRRTQCLRQNWLVSARGTSQEFLCPRGPGCCRPIRLPSGSSGPIPQVNVEWVVEAVVRIPCPGFGSTDTGSTAGGLSKLSGTGARRTGRGAVGGPEGVTGRQSSAVVVL